MIILGSHLKKMVQSSFPQVHAQAFNLSSWKWWTIGKIFKLFKVGQVHLPLPLAWWHPLHVVLVAILLTFALTDMAQIRLEPPATFNFKTPDVWSRWTNCFEQFGSHPDYQMTIPKNRSTLCPTVLGKKQNQFVVHERHTRWAEWLWHCTYEIWRLFQSASKCNFWTGTI